jgi:hypothetical protein
MTRGRNESVQRRNQDARGARRDVNRGNHPDQHDRGAWGSSDADGQYDRDRSGIGSSGEERYGRYAAGRRPGNGDYRDEQTDRGFGGGWGDRTPRDTRDLDYQPRGNRSWNDGEGDRGLGNMTTTSQQADGYSGMRGEHYGKGPKGYRRTDARIKEDVSDALMRHGDLDASDVDVTVTDGDVTLSGTVSDRRMKRAAEECAEECLGVGQVQNNIRVGSAAGTSEKKEAKRRTRSAGDAKSGAARRL